MDNWFGRLLEELQEQGIYDETLIIFTTDHGHMLGEHGITGKNNFHMWNEISHIPLIVHLPNGAHAGERRSQLTQNIDVFPTVLDFFDLSYSNPIHGISWKGILEEDSPSSRTACLYGLFGQTVNITDGRCTYFRPPFSPDNQPLFRHFLTPGTASRFNGGYHDVPGEQFYEDVEIGWFLSQSNMKTLRSRASKTVSPEWKDAGLYNIQNDCLQNVNLAGSDLEEYYIRLLGDTMRAMDAPKSQYDRLGLS